MVKGLPSDSGEKKRAKLLNGFMFTCIKLFLIAVIFFAVTFLMADIPKSNSFFTSESQSDVYTF